MPATSSATSALSHWDRDEAGDIGVRLGGRRLCLGQAILFAMDEPHSTSERAGDHFARLLSKWPRLSVLVSSLLLLSLWDTGRAAFTTDGHHRWLDWVVLAVFVYSAGVLRWFVPKYLVPRAHGRALNQIALFRWSVAMSTFLIGFGAWAAGADQWVATVALIASVVLLVVAARQNRNG